MRMTNTTPLLAATLALAGVFAAAPSASHAQSAQSPGFSNMTAEQRQAFREEVRRYLMEEPELVAEALMELERRRVDAALSALDGTIADGEYVQDIDPAGADLTLIELTDYDCPYCKRSQPEIAAFLKADGKVRHVIKVLPYIGGDMAERVALAAKNQLDAAGIAKLHNALMSYDGRLTPDALETIASDQGLDWQRLLQDMGSQQVEGQMTHTIDIARDLRINGTPAFVLGGHLMNGLQSAEQFAAAAAEIRSAQAKN